MENELKPCPFCGSEAEIKTCNQCLAKAYSVVCKDKHCRGRGKKPVIDIGKAIENWNRRAGNEQRDGEWVAKPNQRLASCYACSVCDEPMCILGGQPKYCPNCGAKMKGGAE